MTTYSYLDARQKYSRPQAILWSKNAGRVDIDNGNKVVPYGYEINAATGAGSGVTITTQDPINAFMILPDHNRSAIDVQMERLEQRQRMVNGRMRSFHIADKKKISFSWDMLPSRSFVSPPNFEARVGSITAVSGNGTAVTYTVNTNFASSLVANTSRVDISGILPTTYNLSNVLVIASNATTFSVASNITTTVTESTGVVTSTLVGTSTIAVDPTNQYIVDGGAGAADILNWYETNTGSFYVFLAYDNFSKFTGGDYNRLNEYNEVIEMFISDFSYNVVKRGADNYDFWNISVTLEEV
jgi:hypothetical protein